jgi:hypothetical protein
MNCGFFIPPVGGTDLPNYPMRDNWQPFLGEIRTYTKVDEDHDFDAWKNAVRSNRVFVTSGPMVSFKINDAELGDRVTLPDGGGEIEINATLSTPIGLTEMELLRNGEPVNAEIVKKKLGTVHLWRIKHKMTVSRSCWFAVRGKGVPIQSLDIPSLKKQSWSETSVIAHSAAIPVIVGDQRVSSREDKEWLIRHLGRQREFYETKARYWNKRQKERMLGYFDEAVKILRALE